MSTTMTKSVFDAGLMPLLSEVPVIAGKNTRGEEKFNETPALKIRYGESYPAANAPRAF